MGLFGSAKKRDAALANPQMYMPATEAPPIPEAASIAPQMGGTFNLAPVGQIKPHIGAFDRGGMGWQVIGAIGDSLSQMGGYGAPFAQARNLERQQQFEEAQWTRRQESELNRQIALEQWKRDHPPPINNDTANDYAFWQARLTPEEFERWKANHIDPPRMTVVDGVPMLVGGSYGYPGQAQQPKTPTAPVGKLRPYGGPTQPASGGFPGG